MGDEDGWLVQVVPSTLKGCLAELGLWLLWFLVLVIPALRVAVAISCAGADDTSSPYAGYCAIGGLAGIPVAFGLALFATLVVVVLKERGHIKRLVTIPLTIGVGVFVVMWFAH